MDDILLKQLELYNEYVIGRIKLIVDFDIWYEHTTGTPFPKEWYSVIKSRGNEAA